MSISTLGDARARILAFTSQSAVEFIPQSAFHNPKSAFRIPQSVHSAFDSFRIPHSSLPSPAKRPVKLYDSQQLFTTKLCKHEFALEQIPLGVKHLKITVHPALIAKKRKAV